MAGIIRVGCAAAVAAAAMLLGQKSVEAQTDKSSPRVQQLLSQLTLEEKLSLTQGTKDPVDGGQAGYTKGVPRLGIPALRWVDGPAGIDNRYDATNLPAMLSIASSFSPEAAREVGELTGREARATRMDVFLGPMVNIARVPNWGRNVTSFGEDPLLTASLTVPMVRGIEDWGVIATTKHFVANNQMFNVMGATKMIPGADFIVDDRTMHEIYLRAFEAAAPYSTAMMSAYNRINGPYSSDSYAMETTTLREEFGWKGLMVSDWGAVHSTDSLTAGLDVEMPGDVIIADGMPFYFGTTLKAAIAEGKIPASALDSAVKHVLAAMEKKGMLDGSRVPAPLAVDVEGDARIARKLAGEGAVLLKNDKILPLSSDSPRSIVLIGPSAGQLASSQGFGAAVGIESRRISPLEAMKKMLPKGTRITFAVGDDLTGVAIPSSSLRTAGGIPGLLRTPDDGTATIVDSEVNFTGSNSLPRGRGYTWTGVLSVPENGDYTLDCQSWGGAAVLKLDGAQIAKSAKPPLTFGVPRKTSGFIPTVDGLDSGQAVLQLRSGVQYAVELWTQAEPESRMEVRLAWTTPAMHRQGIREAVEAAAKVDTAVVFVWQRGGEWAKNAENLALPDRQDDLVEAVAEANPRTIVVLNTAGPVAMPWRDKVKGILEMWFPGQEGGWATADIIMGNVNPSGHLPITFPARAEDSPVFAPGHPERYFGTNPSGGSENKIIYSEGIFVGYRYFDENQTEPLFPFGHGLSYTSFKYSKLNAVPAGDGIDVTFNVRNSGSVAGADVAQVYLGRPDHPPVSMASQALAAFERIELAPAQSKQMKLHISHRSLSYWSESSRSWMVAAGHRSIFVGNSSRSAHLSTAVKIGEPSQPHNALTKALWSATAN